MGQNVNPIFSVPVVRFPEWKTLVDRIGALLDAGQVMFTYAELSALAGIDIESHRGRSQFYKFRRHILKERKIWFEVVPRHGYAVVPANDQSKWAAARIPQARRKLALGAAINRHTRMEELTSEQRAINAGVAAIFSGLGKAFLQAGKEYRKLAAAPEIDPRKIIDSIKKRTSEIQ